MTKNNSKYTIPESYLKEINEITTVRNIIPAEKYTKYNVKRGLRNDNGTGVLVGLT